MKNLLVKDVEVAVEREAIWQKHILLEFRLTSVVVES